jgi:UDP-N-acetylglucosamine 2-epimerase (non-hydrolysing)
VLTDSGGLQEEACALRVPCVTLRDSTERPESIDVGASVLAGAEQDRIVRSALDMLSRPRTWPNPFGDGRAGERTIAAVERAIGDEERATPLSAASLLG